MGFIFHTPRKRMSSIDPRISISKSFISLNPPCVDTYFQKKDYARLGCDAENNKIIIVPAEKKIGAFTIIKNKKWAQRYINAKSFLKALPFTYDIKGIYKCTWDERNEGVLIDIEKDKVR